MGRVGLGESIWPAHAHTTAAVAVAVVAGALVNAQRKYNYVENGKRVFGARFSALAWQRHIQFTIMVASAQQK